MTALAQSENAHPAKTVDISPEDRLIIALDVASVEEAREIVNELSPRVNFFKIGLQLQLSGGGIKFASELASEGKRIFLDSKLWDIEQTISNTVQNVIKMGASFLTVHGERKVIEAAVKSRGTSDLKILAVTFLTNLDEHDLRDLHFKGSIEDFVAFRTELAISAGADGVIASGQEVVRIRNMGGRALTIVTPGIRPSWAAKNEQRRSVTPFEAIKAGADYLVIGRPVLTAGSKIKAAELIIADIEKGLAKHIARAH